MIIKVKDIKEDQVKKIIIDMGEEIFPDIDPEISLSSRVKGEISIFLEDKFCLQGEIVFKLTIPCFRCDKNFEQHFMVNLNEYYVESIDSDNSVKEIELNSKDIITFPVINGEIDLTNVIRDYIITSIPIYAICPLCNDIENQRR